MSRSHHAGRLGVLQYVESLGLQTFGKEREDSSVVVKRPVFKHEPVLALYQVEVPALFGRLTLDERDANPVLDRNDPNLFDQELEELLVDYGPLIWPLPDQGSRAHLREPQQGTRYPSDLIYPRDSAIIKRHLRCLILCRKARPDADMEAFVNKTHKPARLYGDLFRIKHVQDMSLRKRRSTSTIADQPVTQRARSEKAQTDVDSDGSGDSVLGTKTRCQARKMSAHSSDLPFKIELRLYRIKPQGQPIGPGQAWSYGSLMLTDRNMSCEDLFALVADDTKTECNFLIFQLPEDMTMEDRARINRGSKESEVIFRRILSVLLRARRFPCGPVHRSVELEIGFETVVD